MHRARKQIADFVYADRYRVLNGERAEHWPRCVYCGAPADTRDHVPPISRVSDYEAIGMALEVYIKVPACKECNGIGAAHLQPSFMDRAEFIKDRLARKYASAMRMPDWDEDEIRVLGKNLKSTIRAALAKREPLKARVEYYGGVDSILMQLVEIYGDRIEEESPCPVPMSESA